MLGDDPAEHGARAADRDLLADDRPHRCLEAVDRAGRAQSGPFQDERGQARIGAERAVDRDRIGVEIEQPAHSRHDGDQIAGVVQPHPAGDRAVTRRHRDQGRAAGRGDDPGERAVRVALEARDGVRAEEVECPGQVDRFAVGQPQT